MLPRVRAVRPAYRAWYRQYVEDAPGFLRRESNAEKGGKAMVTCKKELDSIADAKSRTITGPADIKDIRAQRSYVSSCVSLY